MFHFHRKKGILNEGSLNLQKIKMLSAQQDWKNQTIISLPGEVRYMPLKILEVCVAKCISKALG